MGFGMGLSTRETPLTRDHVEAQNPLDPGFCVPPVVAAGQIKTYVYTTNVI